MKKFFVIGILLCLSACSNYENDRINTDAAQDSPLLYPPCLKK